jgi:predicted phosphodiesterase
MNIKKLIALLTVLLPSLALSAQIKLVHGPYLQNVTDNQAVIVWQADKTSIGWVELAPDDGTTFYAFERPKYFDTNIGVKVSSELHTVRLTGLKPGTTYRYRVFAKEILSHVNNKVHYGDVASTDVYSEEPLKFTTLDKSKNETSFVVLNDIHHREGLITTLMGFNDNKNADLVFFNGDMISILNKPEDIFEGFMDESIKVFAAQKSPYYVRGNHETRGTYATEIQKYFNPREPHLYYTLRQGPVYFILLDTGEDKPDSDIEYADIVDYDNYRTEQAEWLKTLKDDPDFKSAKFHIVIEHMPTVKSPDSWHGQNDCMDKFTPVLNEMGIDLMIAGHLHADEYHEPDATVKYPVLVNSNNGIVEASVEGENLKVAVRHKDGKVVWSKTYSAK